MQNILQQILLTKRAEVEASRKTCPETQLQRQIDALEPPRSLVQALTPRSGHGGHSIGLIAETKRMSPSAGIIVPDYDPAQIANAYRRNGAAAISVLTDSTYFGGKLEDIAAVKQQAALPVLRKDFIFDRYQLLEARAAGADAVLLIVEAIGINDVRSLLAHATAIDLDVLIEVHMEESLHHLVDAVGFGGDNFLIGINNRDLKRQVTDLKHAERLAKTLPDGIPFVAESGIASREDVMRMAECGACAVLVGEALLKSSDPGNAAAALLGGK